MYSWIPLRVPSDSRSSTLPEQVHKLACFIQGSILCMCPGLRAYLVVVSARACAFACVCVGARACLVFAKTTEKGRCLCARHLCCLSPVCSTSRVFQTNHSGLPSARACRHQTDHVMAHCMCPKLASACQNQLRLPRALFMDKDAPGQRRKVTCPTLHNWLSGLLSPR